MNLARNEREKLTFDSAMKANAQMLTKAGAVTVAAALAAVTPRRVARTTLQQAPSLAALLGLLTLCIGLSGCALSSSTLATPKGELRCQGTIAAVNAEHRTIEIKTNEGEPLVVSILAATKLWQKGRHFTFDQMETGKYVVLQYSRSPEGKFIAYRVVMYDDKGTEPKPYPM
jgi:hypothetical protein